MFRAAYRNFIDHESLVVSHSVDPSVSGVVSGVRWYDFRLSGTPDATCPTYPCIYQQGTIADVANGRSRWMPSIAMDGAENILVGYSTTGKTERQREPHHPLHRPRQGRSAGHDDGARDDHRHRHREQHRHSRWGDYTSMSVDPFDDCTFWYVNQYYHESAPAAGPRAGRLGRLPGGERRRAVPGRDLHRRVPRARRRSARATAPGEQPDHRDLDRHRARRRAPTPSSAPTARAAARGSTGRWPPWPARRTSFTDTTVQGGLTYSYRVIAATDAAGKCQALVAQRVRQRHRDRNVQPQAESSPGDQRPAAPTAQLRRDGQLDARRRRAAR